MWPPGQARPEALMVQQPHGRHQLGQGGRGVRMISTGLLGTAMAARLCGEVTLYGFGNGSNTSGAAARSRPQPRHSPAIAPSQPGHSMATARSPHGQRLACRASWARRVALGCPTRSWGAPRPPRRQ